MPGRWIEAQAFPLVLLTVLLAAGCSVLQEEPGDQGENWVEERVTLPPYPAPGSLVAADIGRPGDPYRYFVDPASLSVGRDGVTRYTVALLSQGGGRNVFYEGIRCQTQSAKRYAYGLDGRFQGMESSDWEFIRQDGGSAYQYILARGYLCQPRGFPFEAATARDRLARGNVPGLREQEGFR